MWDVCNAQANRKEGKSFGSNGKSFETHDNYLNDRQSETNDRKSKLVSNDMLLNAL